jgi:AcrR family transcriptional regulator
MSDRLTKADWMKHGVRTLATEGARGLKVGPMAETLNVSRGSFYWHFRDIAEFRSELLASWQQRATDQVILELEADEAGPGRLKQLMRRAFEAKPELDRAIRHWAADDAEVAKLVASVDEKRVAYIAKLLVAAGVGSRRALSRAAFLYWAYLGQAIVMDARHSFVEPSALDDIGDLFAK